MGGAPQWKPPFSGNFYMFLWEMPYMVSSSLWELMGGIFCGGCEGIAPLWEVPATEMCIETELPLYRRY